VKWIEWNQTLMAKTGTGGVSITPARRKMGSRMTVAVLNGDYRQLDGRGLLDFNRTVETLKKATALMDACLETS
jgi:hypothetical protein